MDSSIEDKINWLRKHWKSWAMAGLVLFVYVLFAGESGMLWNIFPEGNMISRMIGTTNAVIGSTILALFVLIMVMTALYEVRWIQEIIFPNWDECEVIIQRWREKEDGKRMSQDDLNMFRTFAINSIGRAFICGVVLHGLLTPWSG